MLGSKDVVAAQSLETTMTLASLVDLLSRLDPHTFCAYYLEVHGTYSPIYKCSVLISVLIAIFGHLRGL